MTTLRIDDAIAEALRAQAEARGLTLDAYLGEIARINAAERSGGGGSVKEFEAALDELFRGETRELPAIKSTYSREDIYFDHD
jgi:hypothetical protein